MLVSELPGTPEGALLHVFYHEPTEQVERGETLYIFNVVQPTMATDISSSSMPNTVRQNELGIYFLTNVQVSDAGQLEVQYFSPTDEIQLGTLITQISVFGKYTIH